MGRVVLQVASALVLLFLVGLVTLGASGCGGGGGDAAETPPSNTNIQCSHNGDVWLCNERNSCVRDESSEVVAEEESEDGEETARIVHKISGTVTIIAECGSNVNFHQSEDNDTFTSDFDSNSNNVQAEDQAQVQR